MQSSTTETNGTGMETLNAMDNSFNNKQIDAQQNQLIVCLENGSRPNSTSGNVASRLFIPREHSDCLIGASLKRSHAYEIAKSYLDRSSNKILCFLLASTMLLSIVNLALISFIVNSTKLTKGGLADGRITVTENGILINGTLKISRSMTLDSMRAVSGQNLDFTSYGKDFTISNDHGTNLLMDAQHKKIEIKTNEFRYIDTHAKEVGKVLLATDANDNSVSLSSAFIKPNIRSGYNLQESLETSEISGTLDYDLELQSRTGSLRVTSRANQVIQSKVSSIDLHSHGSFLLSSPRIDFDSDRITIEKSLKYFDEVPTEQRLVTEKVKLGDGNLINSIAQSGLDEDIKLEAAELLSHDGWLCYA